MPPSVPHIYERSEIHSITIYLHLPRPIIFFSPKYFSFVFTYPNDSFLTSFSSLFPYSNKERNYVVHTMLKVHHTNFSLHHVCEFHGMLYLTLKIFNGSGWLCKCVWFEQKKKYWAAYNYVILNSKCGSTMSLNSSFIHSLYPLHTLYLSCSHFSYTMNV